MALKEFRVIIAGSRNYNDYEKLKERCNTYLSNKLSDPETCVIIVSGAAKGADALGERYAMENNLPIERYPADWEHNGRAAGPIRNEEMAKVADALIAFWDGKSPGTKSMISLARRKGLQVAVVRYDQYYDNIRHK